MGADQGKRYDHEVALYWVTLWQVCTVWEQEVPSHRNLSRGSRKVVPQKWRRAGQLPRKGAYVSRWQHVRELQKGSSGLGSLWPGLNLSIARGEVLWVCKEGRLQMAKNLLAWALLKIIRCVNILVWTRRLLSKWVAACSEEINNLGASIQKPSSCLIYQTVHPRSQVVL